MSAKLTRRPFVERKSDPRCCDSRSKSRSRQVFFTELFGTPPDRPLYSSWQCVLCGCSVSCWYQDPSSWSSSPPSCRSTHPGVPASWQQEMKILISTPAAQLYLYNIQVQLCLLYNSTIRFVRGAVNVFFFCFHQRNWDSRAPYRVFRGPIFCLGTYLPPFLRLLVLVLVLVLELSLTFPTYL